ncbi:MAG TPA: coagulation factor 5/8 type domain-containing protein [Gaiellaceae bacterium]|nr:coagulation factor 5/8 type domain-containing protein [Gaiellaceae bacterium]
MAKRRFLAGAIAATAVFFALTGTAWAHSSASPNFGPNVIVFTPAMAQSDIQAKLDAISAQQVPNAAQFDTSRYSIFFEPGTYGSAADPLVFQVGYYEQVAGLGALPSDTVINGEAQVLNQCPPPDQNTDGTGCTGLVNFWRSLSNLTINVTVPPAGHVWSPPSNDPYGGDCDASTEFWAASQAAPLRRVIVNGNIFLQDYCTNTNISGFVSGGFMSDDQFGFVCNCGQQQYFVRNSTIGNWSNGVWNQVFLGDVGAPPTNFTPGTQETNVPTARVSEEEPFLTTDSSGNWNVFVPSVRTNSSGTDYTSGTSLPISKFFIASPSTSVLAIDAALALGKNLILTPGVYDLNAPIIVTRPDTIVLGLGFATLVPQHGLMAMQTLDVPGVKISGLIFDAGPVNSPVLLQVGVSHLVPFTKNANDPTLLSDVFFRIGGAEAGKATNSLVVNSNNTIIDDVWAWRADHGAGVGWTSNTADTGLVVNGDNVSAYGLAVEHYQKNEVIWNGQNGEDVFFQNEMPYDVPSQAAWMSSPTQKGYPSFLVTQKASGFQGFGMGSYSFFNQGVDIHSSMAFQSLATGAQWTDLATVFLSTAGSGGIDSVINGVGGSSTAANPDTPVDVQSYP